ncbi:MAG: division/cell wall cluster transcriptional repressor MraZ [Gammaproteobacteria bacterium]
MFREFEGSTALSLDAKGRIAIPSTYRDVLVAAGEASLMLTVSPYDPCLWLYPESEWAVVKLKLLELSDFDKLSRRTKQMMRGHAIPCNPDGQGRIRIPDPLCEFAGLERQITFVGQGNRFEIWDGEAWVRERSEWQLEVKSGVGTASEMLKQLAF